MKKEKDNDKIINLLWTGGWDSTFSLLSLTLKYYRTVQPIYLIDEDRKSIRAEFLAMKKLRELLSTKYPHTRELIKPARYFAVSEIPANDGISSAYESLKVGTRLGNQYDWLARFCDWQNLNELVMSIEFQTIPEIIIRDYIIKYKNGSLESFKLDPMHKETAIYSVFSYYTYPLLKISKPEMKAITEQEGWSPVMAQTWFCHNPTKNLKPCGFCNPCKHAYEGGNGNQITIVRQKAGWAARELVRIKRKLIGRIPL